MAAAFAGVTSSSFTVPIQGSETIRGNMLRGLARVRQVFRIPALTLQSSSVRRALNPANAPTLLNATNASSGIDVSTQGGYIGLLLAELASAYFDPASPSSTTPLAFAQALFFAAQNLTDLRDPNGNFTPPVVTAFANLNLNQPINSALTSVKAAGVGSSAFVAASVSPGAGASAIDSIFAQASSSPVDFGSSSLAAIQQDLDEMLALQTSSAPQAISIS
jgi:hypothetical protein